MRLKPGWCARHSCHPRVIYLWAWVDKTQDPYSSDVVTAGSDYLWNLGSACVLKDENIPKCQNTKEGSHKGNIPRQGIAAAQSSSVSLIKQGLRGGKTGPLQQQWLRVERIQARDQKTESESDEQGCLPCSLLRMLWKKQQDKKCFLGHSWLEIREENIVVCPQKTRKACSCLGHKNGPIQSWNLVVTGSVVEKQCKCINLLDFPPSAGRRALTAGS